MKKIILILVFISIILLIFNANKKENYVEYNNITYDKNLYEVILNRFIYLDSSNDELDKIINAKDKIKEFIVLDSLTKNTLVEDTEIEKEFEYLKEDIEYINLLKAKKISAKKENLIYFVRVNLAINKYKDEKDIKYNLINNAVGVYEIKCKNQIQQEEIFEKITNGNPMLDTANEHGVSINPRNITDIDEYYLNNKESFLGLFSKKQSEVSKAEIKENNHIQFIVYKIIDKNSKELVDKLNNINKEYLQNQELLEYLNREKNKVVLQDI